MYEGNFKNNYREEFIKELNMRNRFAVNSIIIIKNKEKLSKFCPFFQKSLNM
jgi:hypothetical protein